MGKIKCSRDFVNCPFQGKKISLLKKSRNKMYEMEVSPESHWIEDDIKKAMAYAAQKNAVIWFNFFGIIVRVRSDSDLVAITKEYCRLQLPINLNEDRVVGP